MQATQRKLIVVIAMSLMVVTALRSAAQEKGSIELKMLAEKEVVVVKEDGEKEIKRESVDKVIPGDHVIYTIEYKNVGEENADSVVVNNPIPDNMHYVPGTAGGENADVVFSIDSGKTFDRPENLKVLDEEGKERPATAKDYTHIRWKLKTSVSPGEVGIVSYRAELQ